MGDDDWMRILARYPISQTMDEARINYPDKSIIVFCRCNFMENIGRYIKDNFDVKVHFKNQNKFILEDGRQIILMNQYCKSLGYQRSQFVVVNYL